MEGENFMSPFEKGNKKSDQKVDLSRWGKEIDAELDVESITPQDIENAFKSIELSPFDYLNKIVLEIKDTISIGAVSAKTGPEVRQLLDKAWKEIQIINSNPETNQAQLKRLINYFYSVDSWLASQKF